MKKRFAVWCVIFSMFLLAGCVAAASVMNEPVPSGETIPAGSQEQIPLVVDRLPEAPEIAVPMKKTASEVVESAPAGAEAALIGMEKAKSIALNHAGISAGDARKMECEYEADDGVKEYEVDFHAGKYEYSYSIHAETGKILSWEKEIDD